MEIKVIPNGVDINHYQVGDRRDWMPPKLLWVGRLVYQKGLDILLTALGELKTLPWTLTLVGDGPHRLELERIASEKGIAERINFKGWLDRSELFQYYQDANLFVFPSRHEGMPNAILEAMACGLPIVASRIAGNEELVIPDKTGWLVPPEDMDALKETLTMSIPDQTRRKQMGLASRSRVETNYTWEGVARQYLSLLKDHLG